MKFEIFTNKKKIIALIDNDFSQNFIDQRLAYDWQLKVDVNSSTKFKIVNDTSLRMFRSYFFDFISVENDEKTASINQILMSTHMIEMNVILKMSWLKKINFHVNWATSKWRLRKNLESQSTNVAIKHDK